MRRFVERYAGRTVLGIGAHPDDLEISMGGTIALLSEAGARVVMAVVAVPGKLTTRLSEARAAADILGAELCVLEPSRCRRVEDMRTYEIVAELDNLVRSVAPDALFSHSSEEVHHDHQLVHRAVISTIRVRPMDVYFYRPSSCRPLLTGWQPRIWVDITASIDRKVAAIAAHRSQFGERSICVDDFREEARARGLPVGMAFAEGLDTLCERG